VMFSMSTVAVDVSYRVMITSLSVPKVVLNVANVAVTG
jgi:hypothetical protein